MRVHRSAGRSGRSAGYSSHIWIAKARGRHPRGGIPWRRCSDAFPDDSGTSVPAPDDQVAPKPRASLQAGQRCGDHSRSVVRPVRRSAARPRRLRPSGLRPTGSPRRCGPARRPRPAYRQPWADDAAGSGAEHVEHGDGERAHFQWKVSLTVRYAELAAAEAKKKMTIQAIVCVVASSRPRSKGIAVAARSRPEVA